MLAARFGGSNESWRWRYGGPITAAVGSAEYFEVEARNGQIVLTPVRIQRGDALRAKLAELDLQEQDIADAVAWARQAPAARASRKK